MIAVLLSRLAIMPVHPCAAFVDTEWQAGRSRVADRQFNMVAVPKEIVDFHVRAPDVAHDVTRLGARPDFLQQNSLEFLLEIRVVDISVERFLTRLRLLKARSRSFVRMTTCSRALLAEPSLLYSMTSQPNGWITSGNNKTFAVNAQTR